MTNLFQQLIQFLKKANRIAVLTGAGISTESGIADYRSKGGLWDRFQPVTIQEFLASDDKRRQYWRQKMDLYASFPTAQPNAGHRAVTRLHELKKLSGLITQNIDGLHQMAGVPPEKIIELHGTNRETVCLNCRDVTPWKEVYARLESGEEAPRCLDCGGLLKPNTISFGQSLDPGTLECATRLAGECDLFLAVGSTLVVEPAASLPRLAKSRGAALVILTLSATPLDEQADLKITAPIGATLTNALAALT